MEHTQQIRQGSFWLDLFQSHEKGLWLIRTRPDGHGHFVTLLRRCGLSDFVDVDIARSPSLEEAQKKHEQFLFDLRGRT